MAGREKKIRMSFFELGTKKIFSLEVKPNFCSNEEKRVKMKKKQKENRFVEKKN